VAVITAVPAVMRYTHLLFNPPRDKALLIGVNLMSNVVSVCCLTIKARSPLAPLKKGGTGSLFKSPNNQGDARGIFERFGISSWKTRPRGVFSNSKIPPGPP
jgi:hypothetical protein